MHHDNGQDEPSDLWSKPPKRNRVGLYVIVVGAIIFALIEIAACLTGLGD